MAKDIGRMAAAVESGDFGGLLELVARIQAQAASLEFPAAPGAHPSHTAPQ